MMGKNTMVKKNKMNRTILPGFFLFILLFISLPAGWSLSYVQGVASMYIEYSSSLNHKQSVISKLADFFDAGEFGIHGWDAITLANVQSWIDVCDDYDFGFIFYSGRYPGTYYTSEIPDDYRAVRLNCDGTFTTLSGPNQYDIFNPAAAAYRASKLKEKLSLLTLNGKVYLEFNEDSLTSFIPYDIPYYASPTYSDADLAHFRSFVADENARFPVLIQNIPAGSQYKIVYTPDTKDAPWVDWWEWRYTSFAEYINTMAEAVSDAFDGNPCYMGAIYLGSNTQVFEISGMKGPALSLDKIADSPHLIALVSETGAGYWDIDGAESAAEIVQQIASTHNKEFGMFVQLWNFAQKKHVLQKDISIQFERNHKYSPDIVVVYPAYVFIRDNPFSSYTYNPPMYKFWDLRENLSQPGGYFQHADFDWGSPIISDADANPPWVLDYSCHPGGYFDNDRSSYRVNNTENNWAGYVRMKIDRSTISEDVTFTIDYTDYDSACMYVRLLAADFSVVVNDLTGNILTGTGKRLRKEINIPLKDNPAACWIYVSRYYGDYEVFYTWIDVYPGWFNNSGDFEDDTWITGFGSSGGVWHSSTSSFQVDSGEDSHVGQLRCALDRSIIHEDVTLTLDYTDYHSSSMYIQLQAADQTNVLQTLAGNVLTGTGERLTKHITIPLSEYPTAAWIVVRRNYGDAEIFSMGLDNRNPWLVHTSQDGCTWDPATCAYDVSSDTPVNQGSYTTLVDRYVALSRSLTMVLDYTDTDNSNIFVKLTDNENNDVVSNLTGDMTMGTNHRIKKRIPLYLHKYPDACNVVVQRYDGEMELFPPAWDFYPGWFLYTEDMGITIAYEFAGSWDYNTSSWCVESCENRYTGSLIININRDTMHDDILLTLDYMDTENGYLYIQLRNSNWKTEANATGNIITGTGQRKTGDFVIPLTSYPDACSIVIQRYRGDIQVFSAQCNRID